MRFCIGVGKVLVPLLLVGSACSESKQSACIPGRQISCSCSAARTGVQSCLTNGSYGQCQCDGADAAVFKDAYSAGGDATSVRLDVVPDGLAAAGGSGAVDMAPGETGGAAGTGAGGTAGGIAADTAGSGGIPGSGGVVGGSGGAGQGGGTDALSGGGGSSAGGGRDGNLDGAINARMDGGVVDDGAGGAGQGGATDALSGGDGSASGGLDGSLNGGTDAGPDGNGDVGGTGLDSAGLTDGNASSELGTEIASGTSTLIDLFVGPAGIYVLTSDSFYLIDRTGAQLALVALPSAVTSAAFDGQSFVLADQMEFRTYDTGLALLGSGQLLEPCAASVLVSNHRFVCGPSYDWDRIFYTYDALSGRLLASSGQYTYNGIPMKRVPGSDDFVTVSSGYPSSFELYTVSSSNQVVYVNASPFDALPRATPVFSYDGDPAVHLVTDMGFVLTIRGSGCSSNLASSGCLVQEGAQIVLSGDGDLGLNSLAFTAMDFDVSGKVFGLVDSLNGSQFGACTQGCTLESVDVTARSVLSRRTVSLPPAHLVAFRHDPIATTAIIGYNRTSSGDASVASPGYRVAAVAY